jgi:hypothetical protein
VIYEHPLAYLLGLEGVAAVVPEATRAADAGVPVEIIGHFHLAGQP